MALGTYTHVRAGQMVGMRFVNFTQQLTTAGNHVEAGSALDLSAATRGAYLGFASAVDGLAFLGFTATLAGEDDGYLLSYRRAAAGAPATGTLHIEVTGAAADSAFSSVPANTDLSTVTAMCMAVGV